MCNCYLRVINLHLWNFVVFYMRRGRLFTFLVLKLYKNVLHIYIVITKSNYSYKNYFLIMLFKITYLYVLIYCCKHRFYTRNYHTFENTRHFLVLPAINSNNFECNIINFLQINWAYHFTLFPANTPMTRTFSFLCQHKEIIRNFVLQT